ncbi:hypothetical protein [Adhaeribacter aerolatus]|uniref:hypothetical protein n=1 Tax=Adhaeribacter aerolatus TaxID=670289 RepID=UPI0011BF4125|nr:hypothetical protein [Adhaeribacter aerolatus]
MHKYILIFFVSLLSFSACKPACKIYSCHIRKQHLHGKKAYRGQPIWKKQNPRIGEKLPNRPAQDNQKSQRKDRKKQK